MPYCLHIHGPQRSAVASWTRRGLDPKRSYLPVVDSGVCSASVQTRLVLPLSPGASLSRCGAHPRVAPAHRRTTFAFSRTDVSQHAANAAPSTRYACREHRTPFFRTKRAVRRHPDDTYEPIMDGAYRTVVVSSCGPWLQRRQISAPRGRWGKLAHGPDFSAWFRGTKHLSPDHVVAAVEKIGMIPAVVTPTGISAVELRQTSTRYPLARSRDGCDTS